MPNYQPEFTATPPVTCSAFSYSGGIRRGENQKKKPIGSGMNVYLFINIFFAQPTVLSHVVLHWTAHEWSSPSRIINCNRGVLTQYLSRRDNRWAKKSRAI